MAVPVYERQEQLRALPGVRMNAPRADAYGGDVANALTRMTERGLQMAEEIEDTRTLEAFNAFKRDVSQYHNDPNKGVLNRLGKETIGLYKESELWMDNKAEEYVRKMKSHRMVQNFRKLAGQTILSQGEQNSLYEAKQIRAYRQAEAEAGIQSALDDAVKNWQDDAIFNESLETARQFYELQSRGLGLEARKAGLLELESRFAAGRLSAMIQADPLAAEAWYKEHKEEFTGAARVKAEEVLEKETKAVKLEIVRDDLIKRHGMNYATARKEVMEKYQGDEERQVWSLYEAFYSDQKRIRDEAEQSAEDNFLKKLQGFGSEAEAMDYLLKNANSMNRWREGKSVINGRRETEEGALLEFYDDLEEGKFNQMTTSQLRAKIGKRFSKDDFDNDVLFAFKEWKSEAAANERDIKKAIGNDLKKEREKVVKKYGVNAATAVEREYRQYVRKNPNSSAEERRAEYRRLAGSRVLYDHPVWGVRDTVINEAEAQELERAGYYYDRDTDRWINTNDGTIVYDYSGSAR